MAVTGGSVAVFDATSGQRLAGWQAHPRPIESVAASRDVSVLATASDDGTVKLWKTDGTFVRTLGGGPGEMQGVAVAPAGDRVAGAASDTNIYLFESRTGAVQHVLDLDMSCYTLDFSPEAAFGHPSSQAGSHLLPGLPKNDRRLIPVFWCIRISQPSRSSGRFGHRRDPDGDDPTEGHRPEKAGESEACLSR